MSSVSRSSQPLSELTPPAGGSGSHSPRPPGTRPARLSRLATAEIAAVGWEALSGLLFATAVSPAAVATPWPTLLFGASLIVNALCAPWLTRGGRAMFVALDATRAIGWALALWPVVALTGPRALLGAGAFGVMASGVRRTLYRFARDRDRGEVPAHELLGSLDDQLAESTFVVGVVAGHILMLFLVAFLRTTSDQIRNAWWQVLPWLTLGGTLLFTLVVPRITASVRVALAAGPGAAPEALAKGMRRATALPGQLAMVNYALWLTCTTLGCFGFRNLFGWSATDAIIVVAIGLLFAWGISFYQRAWHLAILAPAVDQLRVWGAPPSPAGERTLRQRMLVEFGLPLVFSCLLSLFSSLGLYQSLVGSFGGSANEVLALVGAFLVLVVASGGVIVRAARELGTPMSAIAEAANRVGHGDLAAAVPHVQGPYELTRLAVSIEQMRRTLAKSIVDLEAERTGLEAKVEARTAALTRALSDLKDAQSALLHGEKMASLGQLVAGVAHEINNPLTAIAGSISSLSDRTDEVRRVLAAYRASELLLPASVRSELEALRNEVDIEAALDDLDGIARVIGRSSQRATRIVGDLLHFSRASSDRVPTDLHAGLDEALSLLGSQLRQASVAVDKRYGAIPELLVRADEVNQIFLNLLTNALQAVTGHPSAIIQVVTRATPTAVEVVIEDNGPGVPSALHTRIFDPFFTTKPAGQGTGLGLSISAQIAARHAGSLIVEDAPAGGARFVLRLPVSVTPAPRPGAPVAA